MARRAAVGGAGRDRVAVDLSIGGRLAAFCLGTAIVVVPAVPSHSWPVRSPAGTGPAGVALAAAVIRLPVPRSR